MTLLSPIGLLGLLVLPILLLLHRNAQSPPRRQVPTIRFWRQVAGIAGEKPSKRFRITRLLALQMLIAALLSLAASTPQVRLPEWLGRRVPVHHIFLLDASVSMLAGDGSETRFDLARLDILQLVGGAGPADVYSLIRLGDPASIVSGPSSGRSDILAAMERIRPGEFGIDFGMGAEVARALVDEGMENRFYIFTDAAYEFPVELGSMNDLEWYIYSEGNANQAIVMAETTVLPSGGLEVLVGVANFETEHVSRSLEFSVAGEAAGGMPIQIPANSTLYLRQELGAASGAVAIRLLGSDDQAEDDTWTIIESNGELAQVEIVTDNPAGWQGRLVWPGIGEVRLSNPQEWFAGRGADVTVFDGNVPDEFPTGVVVLLAPPMGVTGLEFGSTCAVAGGLITHDGEFLSQHELQGLRPAGLREFRVDQSLDNVLVSAGGCPLWVTRAVGDSHLYIYLGATRTGSDFEHASFPIVLARLAGWSVGNPVRAGENLVSFSSGLQRISWSALNLASPGGGAGVSLASGWEIIRNAGLGIYTTDGITSPGRAVRQMFFLNGGDESESDIRSRDWVEQYTGVPAWEGDAGDVGFASPYLLFVALALIFLENSFRRPSHD